MLGACAQPERRESPEAAPAAPAPPPTAPVAAPDRPPEAHSESKGTAGSVQRGRISLYGSAFAGKRTASGEVYDPDGLTMAHRTLPFGTRVRVTNLENQRSVEVIVNDRGPFVPGRVADLSLGAAHQLGMVVDGVVDALLEVLRPPKAP